MQIAATERLPLVRVLDNGRRAVLEIPPGAAAELAAVDALLGLARERGVLVDAPLESRVRALLQAHLSRAEGDMSDIEGVIAEWTPPVHGEPARIDWAPGFEPTGEVAGDGDDSAGEPEGVDHYNRIKRIKVAEGQVVGRLVPPGDGVDGCDVCGRSVRANRGRKLALQPDGSVQVEADGSIRALKDGVLSLARLKIAVVDALEVEGFVDFSTGNIDFVGSVRVKDGVRDNFTVKATGDVAIGGLVEAADLLVGGDCSCPRGVAARGSGHLLVDGSMEAAYLNGVVGRIRGGLRIEREIVGCELLVGGDVDADRASIVGGTLIVGGALRAMSIGTEAGAKTIVRIGGMPLELAKAARINELAKELAKRVAPLEERQYDITSKGGKATAAEKESLTELAFEIAEVRRRLQLLELKRVELLVAAGSARVVKVDVARAIHAGTILLVGNREARISSTLRGPLTLGWDENRNLQFRVSGGRVQELRDVASVRELAA
jgi:uncharacterized protein (DUF342 family)